MSTCQSVGKMADTQYFEQALMFIQLSKNPSVKCGKYGAEILTKTAETEEKVSGGRETIAQNLMKENRENHLVLCSLEDKCGW